MEAFSYTFNQPIYFQEYSPIDIMPIMPQQQHHENMSNASSSCFTSYNSSDVEMLATPQPKKSTDGSCLSTGQSKDVKGSKSKKQKKQSKAKEIKAANEEPPSGYIHVRARRGQATDSHSLAERVRRERISERMKKLQGLVPGCDKVIGKALVLDEIINYVQSLQNQVEFLSMKLASTNPILYNFSEDYNDEFVNHTEEMGGSMSQPMPSFDGPSNFSQDGGNFLMQVELNNVCSFH